MEISKIFMEPQQKKKTSTNKQNLIYFLIIHTEQLKIKSKGNLLMKTYTHILLLFLSLFTMNMKIETWILDFYSYCSLLKNKTNVLVRNVGLHCAYSHSWCHCLVLLQWN